MKLNYRKLRQDIHWLYMREHLALGVEGALRLLDEARQWDLAATLDAGGVLVFPHAGVADCGYQIAAVVNACLDSDVADLYQQSAPTWVAAALIEWQLET